MTRLSTVFQAALGIDEGRIEETDSMETIPEWDSITHIQLMLALEEEFGIRFTVEEIAGLTSVAAIRRRLEEGGGT